MNEKMDQNLNKQLIEYGKYVEAGIRDSCQIKPPAAELIKIRLESSLKHLPFPNENNLYELANEILKKGYATSTSPEIALILVFCAPFHLSSFVLRKHIKQSSALSGESLYAVIKAIRTSFKLLRDNELVFKRPIIPTQ